MGNRVEVSYTRIERLARNVRVRDLAKRLVLAVIGTAVALVLAEIVVRVTFDPPPRVNATAVPKEIRQRASFPGGRFVHRPNAEVVHRYPSDLRGRFDEGATVTYRINSLGLRGPETTVRKPAGVRRLIGLGDSFTFGIGVRAEDTFLAVLGRHLGPSFEVLNMGILAYDTAREVAFLRHVGLDFAPDVVVICFFLNDAKGGGTVEHLNVDPGLRETSFFARHSAFIERIFWTVRQRRQVGELVESYRESFLPDAEGWRTQQQALVEAAVLSEKHGFELVLVIFPVLWELSGDYPFAEIHATVKSFAQQHAIPVLDLLPEFDGYDGPELWVHPTDQHPNEIAHEIAGDALNRFIREREMIASAEIANDEGRAGQP